MNDENINFLLDFIGRDWLESELNRVETRYPLKEIGAHYYTYHPYVNFVYELRYLLRRAEIEGKKEILMGKFNYILGNAGTLLSLNFDKIIDKKDARERLKNPEQFYDFVWELEVGTMLEKNGVSFEFNDPTKSTTSDITFQIGERRLQIECKNKVLDNDLYNVNSLFAHVLSNKLEHVECIHGKIVEIEYEAARYEDINTVVKTIRDKFDVFDYQSIQGRYKVRRLKIPFETHPARLINRDNVTSVFQLTRVPKKELFSDKSENAEILTKVLFKYPESKRDLKNLNTVLKKANKQLSDGGIVFLHVPFSTFDFATKEIEKELSLGLSNISAVKLVSHDLEYKEGQGLKVSRQENLIISKRSKLKLTDKEIDLLNKPMAFSKYKHLS